MLNPATILFFLTLISLVHKWVSANKVISYTDRNKDDPQLYLPWQGSIEASSTDYTDIEIHNKYIVRCEVSPERAPVMRLYTKDGVQLEVGLMEKIGSSKVCTKEHFEKVIVPLAPEDGKIVIAYGVYFGNFYILMRKYNVKRKLLMAEVETTFADIISRSDITSMDEYARKNKDYKNYGILACDTGYGNKVLVTPKNERFEVSYKPSQVEIVEFPQKDFKGIKFEFMCGKHETDEGSTIIIGSVSHGDHAGVVIESFQLESCSVKHININRRIVNKEDHFKTVFKKADGTCAEREYKLSKDKPALKYMALAVERYDSKGVPCPISFVGDIGKNAYAPWYIRILRTILFFWFKEPEPYAVEI